MEHRPEPDPEEDAPSPPDVPSDPAPALGEHLEGLVYAAMIAGFGGAALPTLVRRDLDDPGEPGDEG